MKLKHTISTLIVSLFCVILWSGCKKEYNNTFTDLGTQVYTGSATTAQAIPAKTGNGTAVFTGNYDVNNKVFNYSVKWTKLDSTVTSVAIYGPSTTGQPYVLARTLSTFAAPLPTGATGSAQSTLFQLNGLSDFELTNLKNGNYYFVVNTTASPTGAVRGQITYARTFNEDN